MQHRSRTARLLVVALATGLLVAGCSGGTDGRTAAAPATSSSTTTAPPRQVEPDPLDSPGPLTVPSPLPWQPPGSVIASEPVSGAPAGASATRFLYHSTDREGHDIAVSAVVIVPEGPAPPGGRPVLAWAHPTTGLADRCAPSRTPLVFALIPALDRILRSGWVVVATDYQGLGTPGHHPYLVADSEGHSLLDSVRAARTLTSTANEVALYGWSQGGHAALSAGQSAATYAPDLDLVGVAVDAPGGDLSAAFRAQESNPKYWTVLAFILQAYANEYGVPAETLQGLLTPPAQAAFAKFVAVCPVAPDTQSERLDLVRALAGIDRFFATDPLTTGPWSSLLSQNSPGGAPIPAPVRINQGSTDDLSLPDLTRAQADRLQQTGTSVDYVVYPGIGHPGIGAAAATDTLDWFNQGLGR